MPVCRQLLSDFVILFLKSFHWIFQQHNCCLSKILLLTVCFILTTSDHNLFLFNSISTISSYSVASLIETLIICIFVCLLLAFLYHVLVYCFLRLWSTIKFGRLPTCQIHQHYSFVSCIFHFTRYKSCTLLFQ